MLHEKKQVFSKKVRIAASIINGLQTRNVQRMLIVGCGSGDEAQQLAEYFDCEVDGIDISDKHFIEVASPSVRLHVMDAARMTFADKTFDLLYSFHALEHIEQLDAALAEMSRVLKPGGVVFVGTPNKGRLLGYIGSATTLSNKIWWNLADWKMRIRGRWENKFGAHAGFLEKELLGLVERTFGDSRSESDTYYDRLYPKASRYLRAIKVLGLTRVVYPAVYVSGVNRGGTTA